MQVTSEHITSYRDLGYCLVRNLIPSDLIAGARSRILEIADDLPNWPSKHFQVLDPAIHTGKTGKPIPMGLQRPGLNEEVFGRIAEHANVKSAMTSVLGGEVELFTEQIGIKHGWIDQEQGGRSYFHQDSWYWKIDPELGCNCWIPTDFVYVDAIALAVMPKSHRNWTLTEHESYFDDPAMGRIADTFVPFKRHRIIESEIDFSRETLVPMEPGDGLFFTNYTWHRSEPNRTGETKAYYAIAYQLTSG
jgi:ectoine hydroxylase-related dioxygenase (phytanoyl-CoA dioxygenase family)